MIQPETIVRVADNSGAKVAKVIKVLGGTRRRYAGIGDQVVVSVQVAEPKVLSTQAVKRKDVLRAVVVRQVKQYRRFDGSYIKFDDNAVVIINKEREIRGNRIFGPVPRELGTLGFQKITSLAPKVI